MARYKNYDDEDENDYNPNEAWDMDREDDDDGEWVGDMYND